MGFVARMSGATLTCSGAAILTLSTGAGCFTASPAYIVDGGADATASSLAPPPDAGIDATSPEAAPMEAAVEAAPDVAAPPDAGDAAPEAGCAPGTIQGFVAPPYVPAAVNPSSCFGYRTAAASLAADCFGDASTLQACAADTDAALPDGSPFGACLNCLVSPLYGDAGYGATILSTLPVANLAGCVEHSDSTDAGLGCAAAIQAAWQCTDYACRTSCPVTDDPSRVAYIACTQAAAAGVCSAFTAVANTCLAAETDQGDAGVPTAVTLDCFSDAAPGGDPLTNLLLYFCGS